SMRRLARERMLAAVRGQELLNFTLFLDFENYWEDSNEGQAMRKALYDVLRDSESQRDRKDPGFGRIYLFDSRARVYRDPRARLEEVVLFLEFVLFEGQRHNEDLRSFFKRHPDDRSVLSSVGIRTIE